MTAELHPREALAWGHWGAWLAVFGAALLVLLPAGLYMTGSLPWQAGPNDAGSADGVGFQPAVDATAPQESTTVVAPRVDAGRLRDETGTRPSTAEPGAGEAPGPALPPSTEEPIRGSPIAPAVPAPFPGASVVIAPPVSASVPTDVALAGPVAADVGLSAPTETLPTPALPVPEAIIPAPPIAAPATPLPAPSLPVLPDPAAPVPVAPLPVAPLPVAPLPGAPLPVEPALPGLDPVVPLDPVAVPPVTDRVAVQALLDASLTTGGVAPAQATLQADATVGTDPALSTGAGVSLSSPLPVAVETQAAVETRLDAPVPPPPSPQAETASSLPVAEAGVASSLQVDAEPLRSTELSVQAGAKVDTPPAEATAETGVTAGTSLPDRPAAAPEATETVLPNVEVQKVGQAKEPALKGFLEPAKPPTREGLDGLAAKAPPAPALPIRADAPAKAIDVKTATSNLEVQPATPPDMPKLAAPKTPALPLPDAGKALPALD